MRDSEYIEWKSETRTQIEKEHPNWTKEQVQEFLDKVESSLRKRGFFDIAEELEDTSLTDKLAKIAAKHIDAVEKRGDLETKRSDELDFFEVSIWGLKDALIEAYKLGKKEGVKHE